MHPLLFKVGAVPIHTYGAMIAAGFLAGVTVIWSLSRKSGLDTERILDLVFWGFLVGFAGARGYFVLTQLDRFLADPMAVFRVWEGGLVFYGGLIATVPYCFYYFHKHHLPGWKTADAIMPGLTIGHAFGRIGCLFAGCCHGKPTGTAFGITLHSDQIDEPFRGVPLHPTQIYESAALFALFGALIWIFRRKRFEGQVAIAYFMAYPVIRSVIEVFRGDVVRRFVIDDVLSWAQFTSFWVFAAATGFLVYRLRQLRRQGAAA